MNLENFSLTILPILSMAGAALTIVVFPLWMLVDCLWTPGRSIAGRLGWTLFILFTLPIGAISYAFWGSDNGKMKQLGWASSVLLLLVAAFVLYNMYGDVKQFTTQDSREHAATELSPVELEKVPEAYRKQVAEAITRLNLETQTANSESGLYVVDTALLTLLPTFSMDGVFTEQEVKYWLHAFEERSRLNATDVITGAFTLDSQTEEAAGV